MSIKYICDLCGGNADGVAQPEFEVFVNTPRSGTRVGIRLIRSIDGTWNGGHICRMCLNQALMKIAQGDDSAPGEVRTGLTCDSGSCTNRVVYVGKAGFHWCIEHRPAIELDVPA